jgi:hypothetical protein
MVLSSSDTICCPSYLSYYYQHPSFDSPPPPRCVFLLSRDRMPLFSTSPLPYFAVGSQRLAPEFTHSFSLGHLFTFPLFPLTQQHTVSQVASPLKPLRPSCRRRLPWCRRVTKCGFIWVHLSPPYAYFVCLYIFVRIYTHIIYVYIYIYMYVYHVLTSACIFF